MPPSSTTTAAAAAAGLVSTYLLYKLLAPKKGAFQKKVVLITGASSGIGLAAALSLVHDGHVVYGASRRISADLDSAGGFSLTMDVTSDSDVAAAVQTIVDQHGRIDVLVNNAGYGLYGPLEITSLEDAKHQYEVNLFGAARMVQHVIPYMVAGEATIVNMSSVGSVGLVPFAGWYHSSKAALDQWSSHLRVEMKSKGIKVVLINPGFIATEFESVIMPSLCQRAQGTSYEQNVNTFIANFGQAFKDYATPATVMGDLMSTIVSSPNPKTRYAAGGMAQLVLFLGRYSTDAMLDMMAMEMLRKK